MQYANTCREFSSLLVSCAGDIHSVSNGHSNLNVPPLSIPFTALGLALSVVATSSALAQQPVRPLPKVGGCPVGYYASGDYCVPSKSGNSRGAIEKVGKHLSSFYILSISFCNASKAFSIDSWSVFLSCAWLKFFVNSSKYCSGSRVSK